MDDDDLNLEDIFDEIKTEQSFALRNGFIYESEFISAKQVQRNVWRNDLKTISMFFDRIMDGTPEKREYELTHLRRFLRSKRMSIDQKLLEQISERQISKSAA